MKVRDLSVIIYIFAEEENILDTIKQIISKYQFSVLDVPERVLAECKIIIPLEKYLTRRADLLKLLGVISSFKTTTFLYLDNDEGNSGISTIYTMDNDFKTTQDLDSHLKTGLSVRLINDGEPYLSSWEVGIVWDINTKTIAHIDFNRLTKDFKITEEELQRKLDYAYLLFSTYLSLCSGKIEDIPQTDWSDFDFRLSIKGRTENIILEADVKNKHTDLKVVQDDEELFSSITLTDLNDFLKLCQTGL